MSDTIDDLIKDAIAELRERLFDDSNQDENDLILEIADSSVPVYNYDILSLALDDLDLALSEPDIGPAFDGTPTPVNIIAANVFEAIESALYKALPGIQEEIEEEQLAEDEDENGED